ncbi:MAG: hypothetical protein CL596_05085 [Alteromonas sp.]|nr:hypothetical protein [Alteromonas sp.]|tara:strand:- start:360 stop:695 length:336 start_codon:yes stop_codon:yes gene_type:complete
MAKQEKHKKIFGLNKLPAKGYIKALEEQVKELKVERGKDQSYIEELEDRLRVIKELTPEELECIKKNNEVIRLRSIKNKLEKDLKKSRDEYKELLTKHIQLKLKYDEETSK